MKKLVLLCTSLLCVAGLMAQDEIWMRPNMGQWHTNIDYKIEVPGGAMFLENTGFTYAFSNVDLHFDHGHGHNGHGHDHDAEPEIKSHAVKTEFVGANANHDYAEIDPSPFYENYFLSNDSKKWAANVHAYNEIQYLNLYHSIDLRLYQHKNTLKYDVIIHPGGNPADFKVAYTGQDRLYIKNGALVVETTLGNITEGRPVAYQKEGSFKRQVPCNYVLEGNEMHFEFPEGYDDTKTLYIDPELTFSTFTGATSDNWGMTACPDKDKRLIAAGISFGTGYPLSPGALDGTFNGGDVDIGLTKFTSDGSNIVYSTYIGGSGGETPHSLVVNEANELYIMGATASTDFPVGGSPYQASNNGGPADVTVNNIEYDGGTDIFVIKLSPSGNAVLGGTYLGGTNHDGISEEGITPPFRTIAANYGDQLRGEIIVDAFSNVYITSTTKSTNFPIVGGYDSSIGGIQDAVVVKLNSNLSAVLWSTYLGGSGLESGNSLQLSSTGDIFVAGGTTSSNLPATSGGVHPTYQGGEVDGYVMKFPAPLYNSPNGTYLGTSDYDQSYFVQLDIDDYVYVYGQSAGNYETPGPTYINPNSGQFIHKLNNELSTTQWASVFGAGTGNLEISPTAFLVSDCYEIYIAGWGGQTNQTQGSPLADNSTTLGFPTTDDAYQATTSGSNFYLAVFEADMNDLKYATFMGDVGSNGDHVDGGTSRFDKTGIIYHAVCAACGAGGAFPTTPGAFSEENGFSNCNMAAFQFELSQIKASIGTSVPVICIPDPVFFENTSENGDEYFWDFGDDNTSTEFAPTHYYEEPGVYTVMLVVSDAAGCYSPDTAYFDVTIALNEGDAWAESDTICPGTSVQLIAIGGETYSWEPAEFLDNPNSPEPIATIDEETTFTVTIESICGISTVEFTVYVFGTNVAAWGDTAICVGGEANLFSTGGESYSWSPPEDVDDPSNAYVTVSPPITTLYSVEVITEEGCTIEDTVKVHVDQDIPYPNLIDLVTICRGDSVRITAGGATDYLWEPNYNISDPEIYNPYVYPYVDTSYAVTFTNACGSSYDTVDVDVVVIEASVSPDTIICPGDAATLYADGGDFYQWTPSSFLSNPSSAITTATPAYDITYTVYVSDIYGCVDTASTTITLFDRPAITVSPAAYPILGDTVSIWVDAEGSIIWSPPYNIECVTCHETVVYPEVETYYTATVTDENGCRNSAVVPIYFDPLIYVPNAFTPNGDTFNNTFKAIAHNIDEFQMMIFNRWGEVIYTMDNLDSYWDGTYQGVLVLDDVYVWQIVYTDLKGNKHELRGHVVVIK